MNTKMRWPSSKYSHLSALVRLLLLFTLLCFLCLFTSLQKLDDIRAGWGLDHQPLPATQIPFSGINVVLEQYDPLERQQHLAHLKEMGFGWIRQRLDWGMMEPTQHNFAWQESDAILQSIHDSGLVPVITLDGSPAWARQAKDQPPTENRTAPPAHPATFAHFVKQFAHRYSQQVRYYQIWDEPNIAPHWGNRHIEPVAYGQLLIAASRAIRQVDPDAVIITAALAPTADLGHLGIDEVTFLQRLYATGAAPYFDVLALQPIGFNNLPHDARQQRETLNFQRMAWVRRAMLAAGDSATPIWAVRYGWNRQVDSPWGTVSPQQQAEFTSTALTIAQEKWPWLEVAAWAMAQPAAPSSDPLWGFALTDPMGKPQPVLEALSAWHRENAKRVDAPRKLPWKIQPHHFGYLFILLTLWRTVTIAKTLPWQQYINFYNTTHPLWRITGWIMLIIVYHFATWPPLIILCYLIAALWSTAQPLIGLALAALFLPFHFYAKELHLLNNTWPIPPTQAALLCTLPVLHSRLKTRLVIPSSCHPLILSSCHPVIPSSWLLINLLPIFHIWHWPSYVQGMNDIVLTPLLFYIAIRTLIKTERERRILLIALAAGGVLIAAIGWWKWLQNIGIAADDINRLIGTHYSPNHTALYLLRTLFLLIALRLSSLHSSLFTLRYPLSIVLVFSALCLTVSRGAILLGLPAGMAILLWNLKPNRFRIKRIIQISTISLLLIIATLSFYPHLYDQYSTRLANSETLFRRLDIWQTTLRLWWDHPMGIGPDGFYWHYPAYLPLQAFDTQEPNLRHPHNLWLEFGTTTGWLGFVWLLGWLHWLKYATVEAWRQSPRPWLKLGLIASFVASLAHAQVDAFMMLADLAGWFWVAMGLWEDQEL